MIAVVPIHHPSGGPPAAASAVNVENGTNWSLDTYESCTSAFQVTRWWWDGDTLHIRYLTRNSVDGTYVLLFTSRAAPLMQGKVKSQRKDGISTVDVVYRTGRRIIDYAIRGAGRCWNIGRASR